MKLIKCPNCSAEYLPVEIFIPGSFFGDVKCIEKDGNGKIINYAGSGMSFNESYRCDYCNAKFDIKANLHFDVTCKAAEFDSQYKTTFSKPSLFMDED